MKRIRAIRSQKGFTIVELMIATAILSTMLLLVTIMMINIGHLYYKGYSASRVQDNARAITDQVSQYLELSNGGLHPASSGSKHAYCIDNVRFTYVLYKQIGTGGVGQSRHVLWRDANPTPGTCNPGTLPNLNLATPSAGGTEMIAPNSRLIDFSISSTSPYTVSVGVAYGDNDLLCDSGFHAPDDCSVNSGLSTHMIFVILNITNPSGPILCKGADNGQQFCGTSNLTTTVAQRLTP